MARPPVRRAGPAIGVPFPRTAEVSWEEIDRCFRDFRESAVRLVERVHDLMSAGQPAETRVPGDLRLVRSVFGKWSMEVLVALHASPSAGFEELRRALPGISPRVLSLKLKGLEEHGMVRREIIDTRPPGVRYALTDQGWTVAWLSDPVLLFLAHAGARGRSETGDPAAKPPAVPARQ